MFKKYKVKFEEQLALMQFWTDGKSCKSCEYIIMRCEALIRFIDRVYEGDKDIDIDLLLNRCEEFISRIEKYQASCKCNQLIDKE